MQKSDSEKRTKLSQAIEAKLTKASKDNVVDPNLVRKTDPALAAVLDEFILSKSWRTDPKTTAKQVAESLVAKDPASKLAQLIGSLDKELKVRRTQ